MQLGTQGSETAQDSETWLSGGKKLPSEQTQFILSFLTLKQAQKYSPACKIEGILFQKYQIYHSRK